MLDRLSLGLDMHDRMDGLSYEIGDEDVDGHMTGNSARYNEKQSGAEAGCS